MITSVKEIHESKEGHGPDEIIFYNYFICRCVAARVPRYHLFRISSKMEFELLCHECDLGFCRDKIREYEPRGTTVVKQYTAPKRGKRFDV